MVQVQRVQLAAGSGADQVAAVIRMMTSALVQHLVAGQVAFLVLHLANFNAHTQQSAQTAHTLNDRQLIGTSLMNEFETKALIHSPAKSKIK